jgi:hypothetical protein
MRFDPQTRSLLKLASLAALACLGVTGCERFPQTSNPDTIRLIAALRTACSARSAERLAAVRQRIEAEHQAQRLSDAEFAALREIVEMGERGDWQQAEQACYRFQRAQVR